MRKLLCILLPALMLSLTAGAQEAQIRKIMERLDDSMISLSYSCTVAGQVPLHLEGTLLLQGNCYRAEGNGMVIFCDGHTRWTVDPEEAEVYIEDSEGIAEVLQYRDSLSDISISDVKYMSMTEDLEIFRFDTSRLDSGWVVTDLRQ